MHTATKSSTNSCLTSDDVVALLRICWRDELLLVCCLSLRGPPWRLFVHVCDPQDIAAFFFFFSIDLGTVKKKMLVMIWKIQIFVNTTHVLVILGIVFFSAMWKSSGTTWYFMQCFFFYNFNGLCMHACMQCVMSWFLAECKTELKTAFKLQDAKTHLKLSTTTDAVVLKMSH